MNFRKKITLFHENLNEKLNVMFPFAYKSFFHIKNEIFTIKKAIILIQILII